MEVNTRPMIRIERTDGMYITPLWKFFALIFLLRARANKSPSPVFAAVVTTVNKKCVQYVLQIILVAAEYINKI